MSRELRDKADIIMKELKELLIPLSDEIKRLKSVRTSEKER